MCMANTNTEASINCQAFVNVLVTQLWHSPRVRSCIENKYQYTCLSLVVGSDTFMDQSSSD